MLFIDDIIFVDETARGVNAKLDIWGTILESKDFKISRNTIEYMECKFSASRSFIADE